MKNTPEKSSKHPQYDLLVPELVSAPPASSSKHPTYSICGDSQVSTSLQTPTTSRPHTQNTPPVPITADIGPDPCADKATVSFDRLPLCEAIDGIHFDFAFGYRVSPPPTPSSHSYQLKVFDMDSDLLLEEHALTGDQLIVGTLKYLIRYRLEIWKDGQKAFTHEYNPTGKKIHIVVPDGGLGDNLAWVPLTAKFQRETGARVTCVCGEWAIRLFGDLYPELTFIPIASKPVLSRSYANYFLGIYGKEEKAWRPIAHQHIGMQRAAESILKLPFEDVKCRLHTGSPRPFPEPFVCISSLATNPCKNWNCPDGWNTIIRMLKSYGYRVLDIDRDPKLVWAKKSYSIPSEAEDFTGHFPIQERINLLEHADFFIGLPSGLSWLAWDLNVPVVLIAGFTMPVSEFPTPYRVTNFNYCHGCWNDTDCFFDQNVPVWCPRHVGTPREIECTKVITPKMVRDAIFKIPIFQKRIADYLAKQEK